jgi:ABC-2 type transport system permease protein
MSALLRAELLKLRTTRTFAALVATAVVLSLTLVTLTASLGDDFAQDDLRTLFASDFTGFFVLLLGAIAMSGEWRHRTITSSVLAAPDRVRLLAAKTLSYAVAGVVLSLVVTAVIALLGTLILSSRGEPTLGAVDLVDVLWRNLTVAALLGALGVGVGAVLRNQVMTVVGLVVGAVVLEPTILQLAPEVARFGPLMGAPSGILDLPGDEVLAPGVAVAVSVAWAAAAFAAAVGVLRSRDLV